MSPVYISRKFWQWWVIANTLSLTGSLFFFSVFYWGINAIRPPLEYNLGSSIISASFALVGVSIGLAQWLVLKRKVPRISGLWILTNIPGLYVGIVIGYFSLWCIWFFLEKTGGIFKELFIWAAVAGAVGGAIGGLVTGVFQGLLLVRRVVLTRLWLIWIIINTIAWAFSWSVGWAFGLVVGFKAGSTVGPALYDHITLVVFMVIFGMISSFLNGMITGRVLVKVLGDHSFHGDQFKAGQGR